MENRTDIDDHDELDLLLPWYVNGTLDSEEQAIMERHVAQCTECSANVVVLRRMEAAVNDEVTTPMVPRGRFGEIQEAIERDGLDPTPSAWLTPRSIAAGIALTIVAVWALYSRIDSTPDATPEFETATSAGAFAATDYVFAVEFEPDTTLAQRDAVIAAIGGTEIGAGDQPHTYRVAAAVSAATVEELAAFADEVAAHAAVVEVRVVAVQIPIE